MATYTNLPSGRWCVQIRKRGIYRAETFARKRDARDRQEEILEAYDRLSRHVSAKTHGGW